MLFLKATATSVVTHVGEINVFTQRPVRRGRGGPYRLRGGFAVIVILVITQRRLFRVRRFVRCRHGAGPHWCGRTRRGCSRRRGGCTSLHSRLTCGTEALRKQRERFDLVEDRQRQDPSQLGRILLESI